LLHTRCIIYSMADRAYSFIRHTHRTKTPPAAKCENPQEKRSATLSLGTRQHKAFASLVRLCERFLNCAPRCLGGAHWFRRLLALEFSYSVPTARVRGDDHRMGARPRARLDGSLRDKVRPGSSARRLRLCTLR